MPTLIGNGDGMDGAQMPALPWRLGYPVTPPSMRAVTAGLYAVRKRLGWPG